MTTGKAVRHATHFEVDRRGLAKLIEKRGRFPLLAELVQNSWDTDATKVQILLEKLPGEPFARLVVTDNNPSGFTDLSHAFTLFAESEKKGDPTLRGRFNLGEKLVLALTRKAEICSTKGTIRFNPDGTREHLPTRTDNGSIFDAEIRMTQAQYAEVCQKIDTLIPPEGVETIFNGEPLRRPDKAASFECILPTVIADDDGNLSRTRRKTRVDVYAVAKSEEAMIYELGIPVVSHDCRWHVDVQQKVPVNLDRDNVSPGYLRKIRTEILNATHALLSDDDASDGWVSEALAHDDVTDEAVSAAIEGRYGDKRFIWDPRDLEANSRLIAQGYTAIAGGALSKDVWKHVKRAKAARRAGEISPTPKASGDGLDLVPQSKWCDGMREVKALVERLAPDLVDAPVAVEFVYGRGFEATYGDLCLRFYLEELGRSWFDSWKENLGRTLDLILHELAHHFESNHLSEEYFHALSRLGGKLAVLALQKPELFFDG